jgi:hypothetical protein
LRHKYNEILELRLCLFFEFIQRNFRSYFLLSVSIFFEASSLLKAGSLKKGFPLLPIAIGTGLGKLFL